MKVFNVTSALLLGADGRVRGLATLTARAPGAGTGDAGELRGLARAIAAHRRAPALSGASSRLLFFSALTGDTRGDMLISDLARELSLPATARPEEILQTLIGSNSRPDELTWSELGVALGLPPGEMSGKVYEELRKQTKRDQPLGWDDAAQMLGLPSDASRAEILQTWRLRIAGAGTQTVASTVALSADTPSPAAAGLTGLARAIAAHNRERVGQ